MEDALVYTLVLLAMFGDDLREVIHLVFCSFLWVTDVAHYGGIPLGGIRIANVAFMIGHLEATLELLSQILALFRVFNCSQYFVMGKRFD